MSREPGKPDNDESTEDTASISSVDVGMAIGGRRNSFFYQMNKLSKKNQGPRRLQKLRNILEHHYFHYFIIALVIIDVILVVASLMVEIQILETEIADHEEGAHLSNAAKVSSVESYCGSEFKDPPESVAVVIWYNVSSHGDQHSSSEDSHAKHNEGNTTNDNENHKTDGNHTSSDEHHSSGNDSQTSADEHHSGGHQSSGDDHNSGHGLVEHLNVFIKGHDLHHSDSLHALEEAELVLHYFGVGIITIFFIEVSLKIVSFFPKFFRSKIDVADWILVYVSFGVELALTFGHVRNSIREVIVFVMFFRLWRIARVVGAILNAMKGQYMTKIYELREQLRKAHLGAYNEGNDIEDENQSDQGSSFENSKT